MTRGLAATAALLLMAEPAFAQHRKRFEPTDLDLQDPGVAQLDVQVGPVVSTPTARLYAPDFEASLGIASNVELEIDGTLGVEDFSRFAFLDETLVALRIGMLDEKGWAAGVQIGPRIPTGQGSRGLGTEALAIAGRVDGRLHLYAQAGVILDPFAPTDADARVMVRPFAIEGGLDLDLDLDDEDVWSFVAELGGARYFSPTPHQLHATGGLAYKIVPWLELSTILLAGFGGDRLGLLLGASPQVKLF